MRDDGFPVLAGLAAGRLPAPGIHVALGPRGSRELGSRFLGALCPALARGLSVFWIDAANAFDAYGAGRAGRALGVDPRPLLSRIRLARPFQLYQLETLVREKLPALWRGEPVVLSDPFPMLYDEDVPAPEARRVFRSVLAGMRSLPAPWLVLAARRPAPAGRRGWLDEL